MELLSRGKVKQPISMLIGLIAASVLVVGGSTYFLIGSGSAKIDLEKLTVPVEAQNLKLQITASGTVRPFKSVNVSPKMAGRLAQLLVEQGDVVKAGQKLAVMENAQLQAQFMKAQADLAQAVAHLKEAKAGSRPEEIEQAKTRLMQAQARLGQAQVGNPREIEEAFAQVENARSQFALAQDRIKQNLDLVKQGVISRDRFNEISTEAYSARAELEEANQRFEKVKNTKDENSPEIDQLKASVREAQLYLQQLQNGSRPEEIEQLQAAAASANAQMLAARVQLEETVLVAPFPGIVTQKYATEGAFVTPTTEASLTASAGNSSAIVEVATKELEVLAKVPEVDVGKIKPGQPVKIVADAFPDKTFRGQVSIVAPGAIVDQNVTSFEVRVALPPEQEELRSGMNVDLTFLGEPVENALIVPTVAVVTQEGETGVMVPDIDNQPQFQPVVIGQMLEDKTQILRGLREGQRVFIDLPEEFRKKEN